MCVIFRWKKYGGNRSSQQYVTFAQNILDRRFKSQAVVPAGHFGQYLAESFTVAGAGRCYKIALQIFKHQVERHTGTLDIVNGYRVHIPGGEVTLEYFVDMLRTRILLHETKVPGSFRWN